MEKTILIVDDFESTRNMLSQILDAAGYRVLQGDNGDEALKQLDGKEVDLIITDLTMPSMDGGELIKSVRTLAGYKYTPVMLLTNNELADKEKAKQAGATAWLEKPFDMANLLSNVKKMIR